jgi:hypothetical protein
MKNWHSESVTTLGLKLLVAVAAAVALLLAFEGCATGDNKPGTLLGSQAALCTPLAALASAQAPQLLPATKERQGRGLRMSRLVGFTRKHHASTSEYSPDTAVWEQPARSASCAH